MAWPDAFPLFLAAVAGAELSTGRRRRALRAAAAVVRRPWASPPASPRRRTLVGGGPVDLLNLTQGVLALLHAAVGTAALLARRRANGPAPAWRSRPTGSTALSGSPRPAGLHRLGGREPEGPRAERLCSTTFAAPSPAGPVSACPVRHWD